MSTSFTQRSVLLCAGLLLASCGGGGGDTGGGAPPAPLYAIGGTVSGLQGVVVLENNGGDDVSVSANGAFAFPTSLASGAAYAVTVRTQPAGPAQTCIVANGTGSVAGAVVNGVTVTCAVAAHHVSGTITGLAGAGLVLQNNGGDDLPVAANAAQFTFPTAIPSGGGYLVSVRSQPGNPAQACSIIRAAGTVGSSDVTDVAIDCAAGIAQRSCLTGGAPGAPGETADLLVIRQDGPTIVHSANVSSDEIWAGDGAVHVIPNSISIMAPATVTIQPCATVKLAQGAGIDIQGNLATGAAAKLVTTGAVIPTPDGLGASFSPIVFQSMDGTLASSWSRLRAVNKNSFIELHGAQLWGGGNVGGSQMNATIVAIGSSALPDPTLKVDRVYIDAPAGAGIYLSNAAFTSDSGGLEIERAGNSIIAMPAMALGSVPSNVISGSDYFPNVEVQVVENANIFDNLTITTPVPIHFKTAGVHVGGLAPSFVPNVTLTLGPGVTLKFEGTGGIPPMVTFGDVGQAADKNAALVVQGTAQQPVLFTSAKATPAPGDWAGLYLQTSNGSQIDHAIIEYAGGDAGIGPQSCGPIDSSIHQRARNTAALIVGDGTDQQYIPPAGLVTNTTFRNNAGSYAIDAVWETNAFGPSLTATNMFSGGPNFCTQNKNLIVGGCVVAGVDQSGCLVP